MTIECPNGQPSQWEFLPSVAVSVFWIIIFDLLTLGHVIRMIRGKQWFMGVFIGGGLMEVAGFVVRLMAHNNPCNDNLEIVQKILLLVAPSVFAATIYMTLGRTIIAIEAGTLSPIRPKLLTKIFVAGDVACFFIQLAGGAIMSNGPSTLNTGKYTILAGLGLQMILFGVFVAVAYIFHSRIPARPTEASRRPFIYWELQLFVLYGVSALIMVRNLFRVVETVGGRDGYLLSHEWPLYVFDSSFMVGWMAVLLFYFPTLIRPRSSRAMDTVSLEAQPVLGGYKDRRGYTSIDPQRLSVPQASTPRPSASSY